MKNERKIERMGETFINAFGNKFTVVEYKNSMNLTVEFECGYQTTANYQNCQLGRVACPFDKRYCSVGCIGLKSDGTEPVLMVDGKQTKPYKLWCSMINRVYNEKQLQYEPAYRKCRVCDRWLVYSQFLEDLPSLKGYDIWLTCDDYELDKDLLQQGKEFKVYSPETCMFIPKSVNTRLPKARRPKKQKALELRKIIRLTHIETGMYMHFNKQQQVADKLGVTQSWISRLIKRGEEYNGYKIEVLYV